jgi:predicted aspartyl protease
MKMKLDENVGHIHLPVYVNEKGPFDFTLDTGAGMTVISKAFADQLGVETYKGIKAKAAGVGGTTIPVEAGIVEKLQLGKEAFLHKEVVVIDFGPAKGPGCFTPGVIGHDILKDYLVHIDYGAMAVTFSKPTNQGDLDEDGAEWIPFQYVNGTHLMKVPVHINAKGPFDLILDTGASGTVITPALATALGIDEAQSPKSDEQEVEAKGCSEGVCVGPTGVATGYGALLRQLSVGEAIQENMPVGVIDLKLVSPRGDKIDYGVLGYPFLKNYTLIIDYPKSRFALVS